MDNQAPRIFHLESERLGLPSLDTDAPRATRMWTPKLL
jgi:hypothetical protein